MCMACIEFGVHLSAAIDLCHCGSPITASAFRRLDADLRRREFLGGTAAVLSLFAGFGLAPTEARAQAPSRPILLTNLRYFDGTTPRMHDGHEILVEGGRIAALPGRRQGPGDAEATAISGCAANCRACPARRPTPSSSRAWR